MGQNMSYPDPRILSAVKSQIDSTPILVVSKSGCNACKKAKQLLNELAVTSGVAPSVFEIDSYGLLCMKAIMKHLSAKTGVKTVPQIWINGSFVGGNDDIQQLHREGQLLSLTRRKTMGSQTVQDSFGQNISTLRITPFKAEVIPFPFNESFPLFTNKTNQSTISGVSTGNGSRPFSNSNFTNASDISFHDRDFVSAVPQTYTIDDYKQEPTVMMTEQSSSGFYPSLKSSLPKASTSLAMERRFNMFPSNKQSILSNVPFRGTNIDLLADEELLATTWV